MQEKLLSRKWHVLHFIGHGDYDTRKDQGLIALVGADGRPNLVGAERLADLLYRPDGTLRLVVLNSCSSGEEGTRDLFSGTAAALVHSGISAVAAMQFTVSDRAAIDFARGFYTAIAHGQDVDDAVVEGRRSILGAPETLEWVTPVLYVRGDATRLFTLKLKPSQDIGREGKPLAQAPGRTHGQPERTAQPEARPTIPVARLRAMYVEARAELRSEHFDPAIGLLEDLLSLDPEYPDAVALRDTAIRQRDLADAYQQAVDAETSGDWRTAARLYDQVVQTRSGYRDATARRQHCQTAQQIADLQDELRYHAEAANWQKVREVYDQLAGLDATAADRVFEHMDPDTAFALGETVCDTDNISASMRAFQHAADAGHPQAMYKLGSLLATRLNPPDLAGARGWYEKAADAGNTDAMFNLGKLLSDRLDPPDLAAARRWFEKAADAGHTDAMFNLGKLLADRLDPPDLAGARGWYQKAADAGDTDAMNNLGVLFYQRFDPPDLAAARRWYEKAADAGHTLAMNNLGNLLANQLNPPDLAAARRWYQKAADAGHTDAKRNLWLLKIRSFFKG